MPLKTPLQECLPPEFCERGLDSVVASLASAKLSFASLFFEAAASTPDDPDFNFLDIGCGAAHLAEEVARRMSFRMKQRGFSRDLKSYGIDKNPLPSPLYQKRSAQLIQGDVTSFAPFKPRSIHMGVSIRTLMYVDDPLAALHKGWEILRPGGVIVWDVNNEAFTTPSFPTILSKTPKGSFSFQVYHGGPGHSWIVCRKKAHVSFEGFPYEKSSIQKAFEADPERTYRQFCTHTAYKAKSPSS